VRGLLQRAAAQRAEYGANPSTRRRAQYRMFGVRSTANDGRASSPIEVPDDIFERVSTLWFTYRH